MFFKAMFPLTVFTKAVLSKSTLIKSTLTKSTLTNAAVTAVKLTSSRLTKVTQLHNRLFRKALSCKLLPHKPAILQGKSVTRLLVGSLLILIAGCSAMERVVYRPDIDQGNYLMASDVAKLHTGMTQQQVVFTLGTPLLSDPFGSNTWYYVFRQQSGHNAVKQQTLTLTFNSNGVLTNINNKPQADKN